MTWLFWLIVSAIVWTIVRVAVYQILFPSRTYRRYLRIEHMPNRKGNSDLVDIAGLVVGETERAFRFDGGNGTVWLPKSMCEWDEHDKTMTMPEWLAKEKELI